MIIIITFVVLNENDYHYRFGSLLLLRSSCNKQHYGTTAPPWRDPRSSCWRVSIATLVCKT